MFPFGNIRFQLKLRKHAGFQLKLRKHAGAENCCRPTCRCHHLGYSVPPALHRTIWCPKITKTRGIPAKITKTRGRGKLLSSYLPVSLPVSPSRVLRAPGTSPYHLVPKHLRATWPRPEQSHLLPEACSPDGTDKRRQRQRQTERPPPEPSNIRKRFCALYDDKIRYYKKKVSKLYCLFNRNPPSVPIWEHSIPAKITKTRGRITVNMWLGTDWTETV